jgi:hypothetical protein
VAVGQKKKKNDFPLPALAKTQESEVEGGRR